jgi:hypothetical protein
MALEVQMNLLNLNNRLSFVGVIFAFASVCPGQTVRTPKVERWGIEEITLHSANHYANDFKDVTLTAKFTCGGKKTDVSGFFDGDSTWRIRFMPGEVGPCEFTTASNDPELGGKAGEFSVVEASVGNHGPVRVAKTFHFSYSDDKPYFLLGTTLYNWLNRDEALQRQTLDTLGKSPFTKVRFGLFPKWYLFNHVEPKVYPFLEAAPLKFDLDRFNPRFFQAVEARIGELAKLGIEADIILFHPYDHLGFAAMDADHDDAYIRYVVARLSAFHNVWWTMANEYDLFDPKMTPGLKVKDWDHMFQTLEAADPYHHLCGIHNMADWYDHGKPWITHAIIQDGGGHPGRRLASARAKYSKPVVVDEYGYEGDNGQGWGTLSGAEEVSRHWEITMQGGYASHGETYVHPGGVLWWAAGGALVGESPERLGFLKKIMTEAPFQDLAPAPKLAQGGTLLAKESDYYLLRLIGHAYGQRYEIALGEGGKYSVDLIDPWLMTIHPLGTTNGGLQAFDIPMTPCLMRFRSIGTGGASEHPQPIQSLIAAYLGDPSMGAPPAPEPIVQQPQFYSSEYTFGELMDNPTTNALVKKFLPGLPSHPFLPALTVEQIATFFDAKKWGDLYGLERALTETPVAP